MSQPAHARSAGSPPARRRPRRWIGAAATAALALTALAATAFAAHLALTLGASANTELNERVIVNSQGRTLYTLSPETSRHLLCKTSECLKRWPPLTVSSSATRLKKGSGVQGHLGILRRNNGTLQVTLRGVPLYRYSGDRAWGDVRGEGIESFNGTWHAMTASGSEHPHRSAMTPAMPSPPSYPSSQPTEPMTTPSSPPSPSTTPTTTPAQPTPPPYPYPYPIY